MSQLMDELDNRSNSQLLHTNEKGNFYTRYSLFLIFTSAFTIGNFVLQQSSQLVSFSTLLVIFIILSFIYVLYIRFKQNKQNFFSIELIILIMLAGFYAGYFRAWVQASNYLKNSLAAEIMSVDTKTTGCISSLPKQESDFSRFIINPIFDLESPTKHLKRIRVSANLKQFPNEVSGFSFNAGECWEFDLRLKTTRGLRNRHGFDYEKWLYQQNIGATAYLRAVPLKLAKQKYPLLRFRAKMAENLKRQLPEDEHITALILGLTLGIRDDLSAEQWQVLQKTGTSHLLAISGLHIGIAALFGFYIGKLLHLLSFFILRKAQLKFSSLSSGLVIGMLFALSYSALAGFSVSTQRACIMLLLASLALLSERRFKSITILSFALIVVQLIDPVAILSSGTILSFMAVWVLIYLARRDKGFLKKPSNFMLTLSGKIKQVAYLQVLLVILLSVPVAFVFSSVSVIAPLINFILIPVFTLSVVPVLLIAILCSKALPLLSQVLFSIEHTWLTHIWKALEWSASFPLTSTNLSISTSQAILITLILIPLLMPKNILPRQYIAILLMPLIFGFKAQAIENGTIKMTVFDVGQGMSVLIQTENHQLLYDTGPSFRSGSSSAERVIHPWLKAENIVSLSALVLSHSDNDHAGGEQFIRREFSPNFIYAPAKDKLDYTAACEAGKKWNWDGVDFEFIYPFKNTPSSSTNNLSCVLRVTVADKSILLTGDIEKQAERVLLQNYRDLKSNIVFVPHHGSSSSSMLHFVNRVNADYAIIPAGFANRWRFPKEQVLMRWADSGAKLSTIADTGELTLIINSKDEIEVKSWNLKYCRYWHQDCP